MAVDSISSSETIFSRVGEQFDIDDLSSEEHEFSRVKRVKKRMFDFMRDHYKVLLPVAAITIIVAVLVIVGLSVALYRKDAELRNRTEYVAPESTTSGNGAKDLECGSSNCTKVTLDGCKFKEIGYDAAIELICCGCFPTSMKFIRFEEQPLLHTYGFVFSMQMNLQNMSTFDLKALSMPPGLLGSWSLIKENGSYYLRFGGVLEPPLVLDSEEVSNDSSDN